MIGLFQSDFPVETGKVIIFVENLSRMKTLRKLIMAIAVAAVAAGCTAGQEQQKPKNVIYLIGDGMGFGAVSSLLLAEEGDTGFEMNPVIGLN